MLNILLFGPPGSGKGTQSEKVSEKYQLTHISTGDLFRNHLSKGTKLGKKAQEYMEKGNLVPDEVVINMVDEKIESEKNSNGFIFDGFPRTVNQAKALDELMEKKGESINIMIALEVSEDELRKRILLRGKTSGRSDDQDVEKVNTRIKVYHDETLPVAKYYEAQGKYEAVYGIGSIDQIFENICKVIDQHT